jgi:hypothetical protein
MNPNYTHTPHSVHYWPCCTRGFAYYGIWTKVRPGRPRVRIPTVSRHFSLLQNVQNGSGTHTASCTMGTGVPSRKKSDRDMKFTSHLLLVLRLGKSGAINFILYVSIAQTGTSLLLHGCIILTAPADSTS